MKKLLFVLLKTTWCWFGFHRKVIIKRTPSHDVLKCEKCGSEWISDGFGFCYRVR